MKLCANLKIYLCHPWQYHKDKFYYYFGNQIAAGHFKLKFVVKLIIRKVFFFNTEMLISRLINVSD